MRLTGWRTAAAHERDRGGDAGWRGCDGEEGRAIFAVRICGIDDHAIAIVALYVHGSERVRNHRMELATPDLDLIKQAEQGRGTGAHTFAKSPSVNPADGPEDRAHAKPLAEPAA